MAMLPQSVTSLLGRTVLPLCIFHFSGTFCHRHGCVCHNH